MRIAALLAFAVCGPKPTTEPEPQPVAERKAALEALAQKCGSGDNSACAKLLEDAQVLSAAIQKGAVGDRASRNLLEKGCRGGHQRACMHVEQNKKNDEFEAGLTRVTAEEAAKIEVGWTIEQVVEALGQPCELQHKSAGRAHYSCTNTDGSGAMLVLLDGKVSQITIVGGL